MAKFFLWMVQYSRQTASAENTTAGSHAAHILRKLGFRA